MRQGKTETQWPRWHWRDQDFMRHCQKIPRCHPHCSSFFFSAHEDRNFESVVIVYDGIQTCEIQFIDTLKYSRTLAAALMFKKLYLMKTIIE